MYLHQQIVDLLMLQCESVKILKLQSLYTYKVTRYRHKYYILDIYQEWNNFYNNPNNLSKLRYQWVYSQFPKEYITLRLNYIKGIYLFHYKNIDDWTKYM